MLQHFVIGNQSILSILLASLLLFFLGLVPMFWNRLQLLGKSTLLLLSFALIVLLVFNNGRASWIGLFAGGVFLFSKALERLLVFTHKSWIAINLFIFFVFLFLIKKDSSFGRLLIYKISLIVFKNNWLWGMGLGKFKAAYNLQQASYFATHDINSKEALLADNSFYAFDDLWQLLIEIGIIWFAVFIAIIFLLIKYFLVFKIKAGKKHLFYGSSSALVCIITASFFSYPFHVFGVQLFAMVYLTIIFFSIYKDGKENKIALILSRSICIASIGLLLYNGLNKMQLINKSEDAFELSRAGFKKESLVIYQSLSQENPKDGPTLFAYAKQLYYMNQLATADSVLQQTKKYYTDNEVYKLSAAIAYESGDIKQAENDYKTALYMVPNRMRSRYELMNFYLNTKDTTNAIYWANSILQMPVKIPTSITANLQNQTRRILEKLSSQK